MLLNVKRYNMRHTLILIFRMKVNKICPEIKAKIVDKKDE